MMKRQALLAFCGIFFLTVSCSGPCLDERELEEEIHFHYMTLSSLSGGGNWEVSNYEVLSQEAQADSCVSHLIVYGVHSNNSIQNPKPASIFSDTLIAKTKSINGQKMTTIHYKKWKNYLAFY